MRHFLQRSSEAAYTVGSFLKTRWIQTRRLFAGIRLLLADITQAAARRREQQAGYAGGQ